MDTLYRLSEEQNERIFRQQILPTILPDTMSGNEQPTAVVLGGQPGSGKTALLTNAARALSEIGPTVVINGDEFRPFHPDYERLQREHVETSALYTGPDAGRWVEKIIDAAIERRTNIVIESTMRQPAVIENTLTRLNEAGYLTQAHILAVNPRLSWQGVHARFESLMATSAAGARMSPRSMHDEAAEGVVKTAALIASKALVDRMLIVGRGGNVLYDHAKASGSVEIEADHVITREHQRPLAANEIEEFNQRWQNIIHMMDKRGASAAGIEAIREQAALDRKIFTEGENAAKPEPLVPAIVLPDLAEVEVNRRAQESQRAQAALAEAENLSEAVFGNRAVIAPVLMEIASARDPAETARARARAIETDPEAYGSLPGRPSSFWRREDEDRRIAKSAVVDMAMAIEKYGDAVAYERSEILREHRSEQIRLGTEVPAPTRELAGVLAKPVGAAIEDLKNDQNLANELSRIVEAGRQRFSAEDQRRSERLPDAYRQATVLLQMQQQRQARSREIGLSR